MSAVPEIERPAVLTNQSRSIEQIIAESEQRADELIGKLGDLTDAEFAAEAESLIRTGDIALTLISFDRWLDREMQVRILGRLSKLGAK